MKLKYLHFFQNGFLTNQLLPTNTHTQVWIWSFPITQPRLRSVTLTHFIILCHKESKYACFIVIICWS